ncbi:MAG: hypothetical protein JNM62_11390 [Flavobacteriales bacterium]|nr:hypothetical protein [Flavobacteriales bacterium]
MRTFFLALPCLTTLHCAAQEPATQMPLLVSVTANGSDCGQFNVVLFKGNQRVAELPPTKHSAFQLDLDLNEHFSVRVEKQGYRDKTISIDTHVPEGAFTDEPIAYTLDLEPLDRFVHADPFYLDFPCGLIQWDHETARFDHSEPYLADIQLKIALLATQASVE